MLSERLTDWVFMDMARTGSEVCTRRQLPLGAKAARPLLQQVLAKHQERMSREDVEGFQAVELGGAGGWGVDGGKGTVEVRGWFFP